MAAKTTWQANVMRRRNTRLPNSLRHRQSMWEIRCKAKLGKQLYRDEQNVANTECDEIQKLFLIKIISSQILIFLWIFDFKHFVFFRGPLP